MQVIAPIGAGLSLVFPRIFPLLSAVVLTAAAAATVDAVETAAVASALTVTSAADVADFFPLSSF